MTIVNHSNSWLRTYTGRAITPLAPKPEQVSIEDIVHATSGMGRYNCHTHPVKVYPVAQHSVLVSYLCAPEDAKEGLMHDVTEAFVGDVIRPVKRIITGYDEVEAGLWSMIWEKYGISGQRDVMSSSVKYADNAILVMEARDLFGENAFEAWNVPKMEMPSYMPPIVPWDRETTKRQFMRRWRELFGEPETYGDAFVGPGGMLDLPRSYQLTA